MVEDCIFCKMSKGEVKVDKIYENDNFFVIPDANPKVKRHSLIISKKHYVNSLDIPSSLGQELLNAIKNTAEILLKEPGVEGFNLLQNNFPVAGQVVMHVHYHILPRRKDDGVNIIS